ncbi:MAG TPA: AI-2E family transporter [Vicinamibacterales bacterium]|nr:AI-2E family transporter [Vicinamibacterales bacterium]
MVVTTPDNTLYRKAFLLVLVVSVSIAMILVLKDFLMTLLVAAIMAGLFRPVFMRAVRLSGGRQTLAAAFTVTFTLFVVIVPLLLIGGLVVSQAGEITTNVRPIVERSINSDGYLEQKLRNLPGYNSYLKPYRSLILTKAGEVVDSMGGFLLSSLKGTTLGTVSIIVNFFIALYAMFFFLIDGPGMQKSLMEYLPLHADEKELLIERFMSVTRATIKGTLVIGLIQGTLSGLAFWALGIPNAAFWGVLMVVLSILPLIGGALIWVPACIILFATGDVTKALILAAFCGLVVGSVDNVLRPRLVGRDTKMHDLVILFSTLGGLLAIGAMGFIIGPVLAGLFVTSWQIFGIAYRDQLADGSPRILDSKGEVVEEKLIQ